MDWLEKEVVLKLVEKDGSLLKFVNEELKKDKDIVLKAVQQNGYSLKFANEELSLSFFNSSFARL